MDIAGPAEFVGLPIPEQGEYEELREFVQRLDLNDKGLLSVVDVYNNVAKHRGLLVDILQDVQNYTTTDEHGEYCKDANEIREGIEHGFELAIGAITYLHFLRSGYDDIEDYLSSLPKDSTVLPLRRRYQYKRISDYACGEVKIEKDAEGELRHTDKLVSRDAGSYFSRAELMQKLLEEEISKVEVPDDSGYSSEKYINGVKKGIDSAIVTYMQSREVEILAPYERELANDGIGVNSDNVTTRTGVIQEAGIVKEKILLKKMERYHDVYMAAEVDSDEEAVALEKRNRLLEEYTKMFEIKNNLIGNYHPSTNANEITYFRKMMFEEKLNEFMLKTPFFMNFKPKEDPEFVSFKGLVTMQVVYFRTTYIEVRDPVTGDPYKGPAIVGFSRYISEGEDGASYEHNCSSVIPLLLSEVIRPSAQCN